MMMSQGVTSPLVTAVVCARTCTLLPAYHLATSGAP